MATETIIYKSVLLQPGEQFTLPPNSELIAADDVENIDSTCTLPALENLACYTALIAASQTDGDQSQLFESEPAIPATAGGTPTLLGILRRTSLSTAGTVTNLTGSYVFQEPYGLYDGTANTDANLKAELETLITEGTNIAIKQVSSGDRGYLVYITLKTVSSAINNIQLVFQTSFGGRTVKLLVSFYETTSPFISGNYEPPTCS